MWTFGHKSNLGLSVSYKDYNKSRINSVSVNTKNTILENKMPHCPLQTALAVLSVAYMRYAMHALQVFFISVKVVMIRSRLTYNVHI